MEDKPTVNIDMTNKIERLEVFEERSGVILNSLSAFFIDFQGWAGIDTNYLKVRGELQSQANMTLQRDIELVVAVYDSSGRIIGTSSRTYLANEFFGLETFDIEVSLPLIQVSKIRIYPKTLNS